MKWKILVSAPYMQPVIERFRPMLEEPGIPIELVIPQVRERMSEAELIECIGDIDGVISGDDSFTEKVLRSAPKLKVISKWGTGIDSIDQEAAARLGVAVCNTADAFTAAVADTVLGYALCFARQLPWMDRDVRGGIWHKRPGFSLSEATLGVIGIGNVGRAVIRRAVAFEMKVVGYDIRQIPEPFLMETGVEVVGMNELLGLADFVSLNCDLNTTSRHIISTEELSLMKPTAILINTARGPLVDEKALASALKSGRLAGAALDVFEVEPLPEDSELRSLENCLLAPHNANSSPLAYERVHLNTISNLLSQLKRASIPAAP